MSVVISAIHENQEYPESLAPIPPGFSKSKEYVMYHEPTLDENDRTCLVCIDKLPIEGVIISMTWMMKIWLSWRN